MVRPKDLRTIGGGNNVIWLLSRMHRSERKMVVRVPVLGDHYVCKAPGKPIYDGHHIAAARHRKATSGTKIILDIDYDQYVGIACDHMSAHLCGSSFGMTIGAPEELTLI